MDHSEINRLKIELAEAVGLLRYSQEIARLFDDEHTAEVGRFLTRHAKEEQQETRAALATQPAAGEPVAFANELISGALQGGDFSGADIQELAVKHGLLREERREEPCRDEGCACAEYGFPTECYRKTAALAAMRAQGDEEVQ
ncbi:hypothetical protein ACQKEF_09940 [Pseudomonas oryzihabitans]|uniref:hypothetical protein n=1 Tax=Pseudomonas oryzihabitans TaxID=47885 RepID=UPI003D02BB15